jgi:hypothetical protein
MVRCTLDYKRDVKRKLRQAQRSYVEQEIKNPKDTGNMWKVIRTCIPKKTTGNKSFSNDKSVANNFNEFFTAVGSDTVMKIKSLAKENNYTPSQLPFVPTNYTESDQFTFEPVECSLNNSFSSGDKFHIFHSIPSDINISTSIYPPLKRKPPLKSS